MDFRGEACVAGLATPGDAELYWLSVRLSSVGFVGPSVVSGGMPVVRSAAPVLSVAVVARVCGP